jgi:hypothetical protein
LCYKNQVALFEQSGDQEQAEVVRAKLSEIEGKEKE